MRQPTPRRSSKAGLPPGTPVHIGRRQSEQAKITILDYDEAGVREQALESLDQCVSLRGVPGVTWVSVVGLHDIELLERLGECFRLHPLVLEDIANTDQRPKLEDYDGYLFIVAKALDGNARDAQVDAEQVCLVLGPNFVISFEELESDLFGSVRERIRAGRGHIRNAGADYLAYSLLDALVDRYFVTLEVLGEKIENFEEELVTNPTVGTLRIVHRLKSEMIVLRKSVWPLREVIAGLSRAESSLINQATVIYLRDVYDHTIEVIDTMETYREMVSGMLDIYLSSISNRMNEIMKVLTIIATIFIPLTFITGIFGMNFARMPGLRWEWGYFATLGAMFLVGVGMLLYFRKRKWL